jgi:hypothetical protein
MAIGNNVTPSATSQKHPGDNAMLASCGIDKPPYLKLVPWERGYHIPRNHISYLENYKIGKL